MCLDPRWPAACVAPGAANDQRADKTTKNIRLFMSSVSLKKYSTDSPVSGATLALAVAISDARFTGMAGGAERPLGAHQPGTT